NAGGGASFAAASIERRGRPLRASMPSLLSADRGRRFLVDWLEVVGDDLSRIVRVVHDHATVHASVGVLCAMSRRAERLGRALREGDGDPLFRAIYARDHALVHIQAA